MVTNSVSNQESGVENEDFLVPSGTCIDDWFSISEQPWTLTERAMQGSARAGKDAPWLLGWIANPSAAITPAEKGEAAMKLFT